MKGEVAGVVGEGGCDEAFPFTYCSSSRYFIRDSRDTRHPRGMVREVSSTTRARQRLRHPQCHLEPQKISRAGTGEGRVLDRVPESSRKSRNLGEAKPEAGGRIIDHLLLIRNDAYCDCSASPAMIALRITSSR